MKGVTAVCHGRADEMGLFMWQTHFCQSLFVTVAAEDPHSIFIYV